MRNARDLEHWWSQSRTQSLLTSYSACSTKRRLWKGPILRSRVRDCDEADRTLLRICLQLCSTKFFVFSIMCSGLFVQAPKRRSAGEASALRHCRRLGDWAQDQTRSKTRTTLIQAPRGHRPVGFGRAMFESDHLHLRPSFHVLCRLQSQTGQSLFWWCREPAGDSQPAQETLVSYWSVWLERGVRAAEKVRLLHAGI